MTNELGLRDRSTLAAVFLVFAGLVAACGTDPAEIVADPGDLRHIHDFAMADDGTLLAASHTGLYRIEGLERALLVGTERHDLMAMIREDDGDLLASGHPDLRLERYRVDGKEPHLGLIESSDLGRSWNLLGMLGEADFHALAAAPNGTYAAESTGGAVWFRSAAGEWERRGALELNDLAVDPDDSSRVLGTALDGGLWYSIDGGIDWTEIPDAGEVVEVEWPSGDSTYGIDATGKIWSAADPESEWAIVGDGPSEVETFWIDSGTWWVGVHGGDIWRSDNSGADWVQVYLSNP